jgi:hypothetical protein
MQSRAGRVRADRATNDPTRVRRNLAGRRWWSEVSCCPCTRGTPLFRWVWVSGRCRGGRASRWRRHAASMLPHAGIMAQERPSQRAAAVDDPGRWPIHAKIYRVGHDPAQYGSAGRRRDDQQRKLGHAVAGVQCQWPVGAHRGRPVDFTSGGHDRSPVRSKTALRACGMPTRRPSPQR